MLSKLLGRVNNKRADSIVGWCIVATTGILAGVGIYAYAQTRELTVPIMGSLLLALIFGGGSLLIDKIKTLEKKLGYREMADEQAEKDSHCPRCGFPIDRKGFLKDQDYSKDAKYDCPNCGRNLITIKASGGGPNKG